MRLAVFSDIHGNLPALGAALADMDSCGDFDQIWCLGDLAALGGDARECIQTIARRREGWGKDRFMLAGGNTDRYLVTGERIALSPPKAAVDYAAHRQAILQMSAIYAWNTQQLGWDEFALLRDSLGRELKLDVAGYGQVIGFHAIPGDDEATALRPDSPDEEAADALLDRAGRLALCGHTHQAFDRALPGWRVINPGSVGMSANNPGAAEWALLTWQDGELIVELRRAAYDMEAALRGWAADGHPHIDWMRGRLRG
ncbi:MAG: metallophosphoesterase family protein [Chloroflexi bacterium]|nr:metallophosphoesterase family protein [Chloroflexota bacterium]MCY4245991.1 metallophosphoesterase family protein [Chloroflexota bacterium]